VFRTVNDQLSLWDAILPAELLVLPAELARVDALLDEPVFFAPFTPYFDPRIGRPSVPMETYLRMMFLKFRYRLGFGSFRSPTPTLCFIHSPEPIPVLAPGQATYQLHLRLVPRAEQVTEYLYFTFTDARGVTWSRFGSSQPVQQVPGVHSDDAGSSLGRKQAGTP